MVKAGLVQASHLSLAGAGTIYASAPLRNLKTDHLGAEGGDANV